jgi:hypothetical protein
VTTLSEQPSVSRRRRPPRIAPYLWALLILAGTALAWFLVRRPRLVFTNDLAAPVWLAVGQGSPITVPPGVGHTVAVPGSGSVVVQWNLARPLSANDRPMGEELRGSLVLREPKGKIRHRAQARPVGAQYFAPLITNATEDLLRIRVNAGLEGAVDCECAVRPGARRVFVGYYRLYRNSTVQARDSKGRTATFVDLGPRVTTSDGTVGLRFESKDFRQGVRSRESGVIPSSLALLRASSERSEGSFRYLEDPSVASLPQDDIAALTTPGS